MDRETIIIQRKSIHTFLSNISFNKSYYELYNSILTRKQGMDNIVFIFLVCQTAFQVGFDGYFDEFYTDICKRKKVYLKHILHNFRTAQLSKISLLSSLKKLCCSSDDREIIFNRIIQTHQFDSFLADIFIEENQELKQQFIIICELILSQHQPTINRRIVPAEL
jgi:hypothetical protein